MILPRVFGLLAATAGVAKAVNITGYEYVVVGSGAGGGPLAARLALAGHKTLLLEAGDDQGETFNYTIPAYSARASEDEKLSWNFFVHHYADDERQARDFKTTYETPDGQLYTGLNPPQGSKLMGTLYPRTGGNRVPKFVMKHTMVLTFYYFRYPRRMHCAQCLDCRLSPPVRL